MKTRSRVCLSLAALLLFAGTPGKRPRFIHVHPERVPPWGVLEIADSPVRFEVAVTNTMRGDFGYCIKVKRAHEASIVLASAVYARLLVYRGTNSLLETFISPVQDLPRDARIVLPEASWASHESGGVTYWLTVAPEAVNETVLTVGISPSVEERSDRGWQFEFALGEFASGAGADRKSRK
jgi:hypothetical protein